MILSRLEPIDRVCLALTCKNIASAATSSSLLRVPSWTPWLFMTEHAMPPKDSLIQRLAHGWTDKSTWRYCQKCRRILPRDGLYFQKRIQIGLGLKSLPWNHKTCLSKEKWSRLSNKRRVEYVISMWCESKEEDSSVFSCTRCWTREFNVMPRESPENCIYDHDIEKFLATSISGSNNVPQVPVECPCCVLDSLMNTYKEPRKPKIRPFLWKWTRKTFSCLGQSICVFIYLIYLLLKLPFDAGRWSWRKFRRSGFEYRKMLCIK